MNHFASAALQALHTILGVGVEQHGLCHPPASPGGVLQHRAFQALGLVVSRRKSRPFWVRISPVPPITRLQVATLLPHRNPSTCH